MSVIPPYGRYLPYLGHFGSLSASCTAPVLKKLKDLSGSLKSYFWTSSSVTLHTERLCSFCRAEFAIMEYYQKPENTLLFEQQFCSHACMVQYQNVATCMSNTKMESELVLIKLQNNSSKDQEQFEEVSNDAAGSRSHSPSYIHPFDV